METNKPVSSWGIWDFKLPETWAKIGLIVGGAWALKSWVLPTLDTILTLLNHIAWTGIQGIIAATIIAILLSPIWNRNIRTLVFNSIDIFSWGLLKLFVKRNPTAWYESQKRELDDFIGALTTSIQEFRGRIRIMTDQLKDNKKKIMKALNRHEAGQGADSELDTIEAEFAKMNLADGEFDEQVLDRYDQALAQRNDVELAASQAVGLEDYNRELGELITDLIDVCKNQMLLKQDSTQLSQKMGQEIQLMQLKRETTGSLWRLLAQARKLSSNSLKAQLTAYARQVVNQQYADAIGQFKSLATQGDQLLRETRMDTRAASRTAKQLLQKYRQARTATGTTADAPTGATLSGQTVRGLTTKS